MDSQGSNATVVAHGCATDALPLVADARRDQTVHVVTPARGNTTYHRMVTVDLRQADIRLEASWPFRVFYRPLQIPAASVAVCRDSSWQWGAVPDRKATILWLQGAGIEVHFPDDDGHVRAWCDEHEIPESAAPPR